jgi:hypothetical protein
MTYRQIARAVSENNQEALYTAFANAALKGNAYAFQQLADRAYGKLKERVEYDVSEYREMSDEALIERLHQLEAQLGIVRDHSRELGHPLPLPISRKPL